MPGSDEQLGSGSTSNMHDELVVASSGYGKMLPNEHIVFVLWNSFSIFKSTSSRKNWLMVAVLLNFMVVVSASTDNEDAICNNSTFVSERNFPSNIPSYITRFHRDLLSQFYDEDCLRCQDAPSNKNQNLSAYEQISAGLDYSFGSMRFEALVATQIQLVANFLLVFLGGIPPPSYGLKGLFGIPWALWMLLQVAQVYLTLISMLVIVVSYLNMDALYFSCMTKFYRNWSWIAKGTECLNAMHFNGFFFHPLIVAKFVVIGQSCIGLRLGWKLATWITKGNETMAFKSNIGTNLEYWISLCGLLKYPIRAAASGEEDGDFLEYFFRGDEDASITGNPPLQLDISENEGAGPQLFSRLLFSFVRVLTTPIMFLSYYLFMLGLIFTMFTLTGTGIIFGYVPFIPISFINAAVTCAFCAAVYLILKFLLKAIYRVTSFLGIAETMDKAEEEYAILEFIATFKDCIGGFLFYIAALAPYTIGVATICSAFKKEPTIDANGEQKFDLSAIKMFYQYTFQWFMGMKFAVPMFEIDLSELTVPNVGVTIEYISGMFGEYTNDDFDYSLFVTATGTLNRLVFAISLIKAGLMLLKQVMDVLTQINSVVDSALFSNVSAATIYRGKTINNL